MDDLKKHAATIKWNAVKGAQGYFIFRAESLNPALVTATTFTDTTIQSGVAYVYTVRAFENGAVSNESQAAEVEIK